MQMPDEPDLPEVVEADADSPAGHEAPLSGTGARGTADVGAAPVVLPSDEPSRRERVRRRLCRRIARPEERSDVEIIAQRLADEQRDDE